MLRRSEASGVIRSTRQPGMGKKSDMPMRWEATPTLPTTDSPPSQSTQSAGEPLMWTVRGRASGVWAGWRLRHPTTSILGVFRWRARDDDLQRTVCCSVMMEGPVRCALMSGLASQRLSPLLAIMGVRLRVGHQSRRRAQGTQGSSVWPDPSRRRTSRSRGTAPSAGSTEHVPGVHVRSCVPARHATATAPGTAAATTRPCGR